MLCIKFILTLQVFHEDLQCIVLLENHHAGTV